MSTASRLVAYTKKLNAEHAANGDVEGARRLLELMLAEGLVPSVVTANTLIKTYREARMPKGAEAVLREMALDWGLAADGASYCTVIDAWGLSGSPSEAARVLEAAEAAGAADSRCYAARLRHVANADDVAPLLARARRRGVTLDLPAFNAALAAFAAAGRAAEAERHVAELTAPPARVRPDARSHALRLKAHCVGGDVAGAEALLLRLLEAEEADRAGSSGAPSSLTAAVTAVMDGHVSGEPPAVDAASQLMETAVARGVKPDTAMFNVLIKGHAASSPPQPHVPRSGAGTPSQQMFAGAWSAAHTFGPHMGTGGARGVCAAAARGPRAERRVGVRRDGRVVRSTASPDPDRHPNANSNPDPDQVRAQLRRRGLRLLRRPPRAGRAAPKRG